MEHWLTINLVLTLWLGNSLKTLFDFIGTEGLAVSLDCTFETTDTNPYLFWYKQQINDFPRFVLQRTTFGGKEAEEFPKERFDAQIQNKSVNLRIQNLQLSDSALYYCALSGKEGASVTLKCTYETCSENVYLLEQTSA
uniref:Ig-like domain-containing protein n=1 Tax=Gadus morhua TaxID=8049 RepID=A0A8C4ZBQ8_GADMO